MTVNLVLVIAVIVLIAATCFFLKRGNYEVEEHQTYDGPPKG